MPRFPPLRAACCDPAGLVLRRPNGTVLSGTTPHECCGPPGRTSRGTVSPERSRGLREPQCSPAGRSGTSLPDTPGCWSNPIREPDRPRGGRAGGPSGGVGALPPQRAGDRPRAVFRLPIRTGAWGRSPHIEENPRVGGWARAAQRARPGWGCGGRKPLTGDARSPSKACRPASVGPPHPRPNGVGPVTRMLLRDWSRTRRPVSTALPRGLRTSRERPCPGWYVWVVRSTPGVSCPRALTIRPSQDQPTGS